jgi:outer membrane receptor protein involved in Fe transport
VTTWKAGAVWQPVDGIRVRAALSHDVRAANVVELFSPNSTGFASISDPARAGASSQIGPISSGNANLSPEKANTTTLGVVFNPKFLQGVYASLDFYNIDISGIIGTVSAQQTLNYCAANPTVYAYFCDRIIRDATQATPGDPGPVSTIYTPYTNLAAGHSRGLDLELGYNHSLDIFAVHGDLALRLFSTYVFHNSTTVPGAPATLTTPAIAASTTDSDSLSGRFITLMAATYRVGPWTGGLQEHVIGGGRFSVVDPRYPHDTSPSQVTTDLSLKRQMGKTWELYGSVINIFDKDPPHYPFTGPSSGFGTSTLFDTQGRRFEVGAKFKI